MLNIEFDAEYRSIVRQILIIYGNVVGKCKQLLLLLLVGQTFYWNHFTFLALKVNYNWNIYASTYILRDCVTVLRISLECINFCYE